MKLFFSVALFLTCFTSCVEKQKENKAETKVDNNFKQYKQSNLESKSQIYESGRCRISQEMVDIISLLNKNNYNIDSTLTQDTIQFKAYEDLKLTKVVKFEKYRFNSFVAKKKVKMPGLTEELYPRFTVYEICFADEKLASTYEKELNEIISSPDIFNEKNYDYLIRNKDKIIYVNCGVKIFEQYALEYKERIEEIIIN